MWSIGRRQVEHVSVFSGDSLELLFRTCGLRLNTALNGRIHGVGPPLLPNQAQYQGSFRQGTMERLGVAHVESHELGV